MRVKGSGCGVRVGELGVRVGGLTGVFRVWVWGWGVYGCLSREGGGGELPDRRDHHGGQRVGA